MAKKLLMLLSLLCGASVHAMPPADPTRLDEVAERGSHVMPFALEKTLHIFNKTPTGGIQQVIAKDATDSEQISLIRRHLAHIAARFAEGDFSGPQSIHGNDMPGVKELSTAKGQSSFIYRDLPNGAEIEFRADNQQLIDAVHRYFDAQLSDHARHALPGEHDLHHGHHP